MVGADTWSMEVIPNPNKDLQFPVHQLLIPRNGTYIFENLVTEELARDHAYEFAFFFAPLKLKGATRSPGNPLAIRRRALLQLRPRALRRHRAYAHVPVVDIAY